MSRQSFLHPIVVSLLALSLFACDGPAGDTEQASTGELAAVDTATPPVDASETLTGTAEPAGTGSLLEKEIIVLPADQTGLDWLDSAEAWGGLDEAPSLGVPYLLFTAVGERWETMSNEMTVQRKKQIFYRFMLPLVLHANKMVRERRARVLDLQAGLADGRSLTPEDIEFLRQGLVELRIAGDDDVADLSISTPELGAWLDQVLVRLDEIPAGLALGQAAYESGYGTSRFAIQGNALFGQWTYGGEGIKPEEQRTSLGDHRIASFEWPFDSVRGYFMNLMSHPSYADFRRLRAQQRAAGEPLDSLVLADGLLKYSERGQAYVDDLKGIISHNGLDEADDVELRDEPMHFVVVADDQAAVADIETELDQMRESGELVTIYERMRLD
ncbi:hypothetical protein F3N42_13270 [Marinihelvus fidelis]|uniref:Mannosyl-glycoprotein endo-beta-N-acetylglucosamidase-like domain-containing protein n=1 Tax=Marinihelvus fidelis TaxID=2613842 RepID=A0A5N0T5T8_9GAMM|nr:glucosaminidase domain-containing protein [Marinihelvus fidelis]KAA9130303.1 hypothetical protein F3N42_13270 [Marinihelvus fidelis]